MPWATRIRWCVRWASNSIAEAGCKTLILKLGERGLLTFRSVPKKDEDVRAFVTMDSFAEKVIDAVGSGDALLAYAALALFATKNSIIASVLGSFAAADRMRA